MNLATTLAAAVGAAWGPSILGASSSNLTINLPSAGKASGRALAKVSTRLSGPAVCQASTVRLRAAHHLGNEGAGERRCVVVPPNLPHLLRRYPWSRISPRRLPRYQHLARGTFELAWWWRVLVLATGKLRNFACDLVHPLRHALHVISGRVHRDARPGVDLRRRGFDRCAADMGLLLCPDHAIRRRSHACPRCATAHARSLKLAPLTTRNLS